jgi:pyruvate dehydrogenase E2 component (dihydrolipoamide acetyltransferase)
MSTHDFLLPDLGEGLTEAEIVEWRVAVGDVVIVDQPVAAVETAKAVIELPCPYAGRVLSLHGAVGDVLPVGTPLMTLQTSGPVPASGTADEPDNDRRRDAVLVGYGPPSADRTGAPARGFRDVRNVPVISPTVRALARREGIDLASLEPRGSGGIVRRADVLAALDRADGRGAGDVIVRLTGRRRTAVERLTRSRREIPDVTVWMDVDATELTAGRVTGADRAATTPLARIAFACVSGLRRHPWLNARVDATGDVIRQLPDVHLGVAVQARDGLLVPVVRNADRLTAAELAAAVADAVGAARAGTLSPNQLTGGTFTINNYGVFGVDGATPIINHPEVGIVGIGRIVERPWVHEGELAIRKIVQITLTFDHRVCDGVEASAFLRYIADDIERPTRSASQTSETPPA